MQHFRLNVPTIAVHNDEGKDVAVTLPEGAMITAEATGDNQDGSKLAEATWQGKPIQLFLGDLWERGELVLGARGNCLSDPEGAVGNTDSVGRSR